MGGVFSHAKGYTSVVEILPALAFHAIISAVGLFCIVKAVPKKV